MNRPSAPSVYLLIRAIFALTSAIMFTTYALYYVQMLGLNPLQLVLVGTAVEVTVLLFEVPTGVVADTYSRRLSVVIGVFVLAGAYLLEGSVPFLSGALSFFAWIVVAEVIRGIGWTFISGAREAWIADEIGADRLGALLLRSAKVERLLRIGGILLSVALANTGLHLPYLTGGALLLLLGLFLLAFMEEQNFKPQPRSEGGSSLGAMITTFREGLRSVRGRPVLMALLATSLIGGAASEGFARLWEAHVLISLRLPEISSLPPATWFGAFALASALLGATVAHISEKRLNLDTGRRVTATLLITSGLHSALVLAFALAPSLGWAIGALLLMNAVGAVYHPVYETWLNQHVDSRVRATVLSMMGQMDALGQSGGGPAVGWVGTRFSLRSALATAALLATPALAVYGWAFRRERPQSKIEEAPAD